jgi:aminopeptidase N
MMPSRGNNGWIDEALASWRDNGYNERAVGSLSPSKMGAHSQYRRTTDRDAYSKGARFMAYLNYDLKEKGGLRPFLKEYFSKYNQQSFITQNFKDEIEAWAGKSYDYVFNPYVYGRGYKKVTHDHHHDNPMHPKTTYQEELLLL